MSTTHEASKVDQRRWPVVVGRLPLHMRWTDYHAAPDGRVVEVDHYWTTARGWGYLPESRSSAWATRRIMGFVLAHRLVF